MYESGLRFILYELRSELLFGADAHLLATFANVGHGWHLHLSDSDLGIVINDLNLDRRFRGVFEFLHLIIGVSCANDREVSACSDTSANRA